jgi:N-acetylmuramoyl-L-alanine amidase
VKKAILLPVLLSIFFLTTDTLPNIKPASLKVKTVVIDAGHGGKDPGCHGSLYKEKDIALAVALKLGKFIEDNFKDVKVIFTRKTDVFVELNERAAIANRNNADLFICVHCNSACVYDKRTHKETCNEEAHGSETYVMGPQKDAGNLDVAKRENKSILLEDDYKKKYDGFDPNSDEANIIFTFYQNVFLNQSRNLALKIQDCYKDKAGRNDKGVRQAGFLVLWRTAMPSLLTELGFLTNRKEEKFLGSDKGQSMMASSIFRAFRSYKNEIEGTNLKFSDDFEKAVPYDPEKDSVEVKEEKKTETGVKTPEGNNKKDGAQSSKGTGANADNSAQPSRAAVEKRDSTPDDKYDSHAYPPKKGKESQPAKVAVSSAQKGEVGSDKNSGMVVSELPKETPVSKEELVYKVLFYASDKKLETGDKKFTGLENVEVFEEGGFFKYTSGTFSKMGEANHCQTELRKKGFKDAFVTCFRNGKRVK